MNHDALHKNSAFNFLGNMDALIQQHTISRILSTPPACSHKFDWRRERSVDQIAATSHDTGRAGAGEAGATRADRLLERALEVEGRAPMVIDTPDAAEGTLPLPHSGCTVVKVNGDYLETVQRTRQRSSASTTTALMHCSGASSSLKSPRSSPPQIADSTHARGERVTRHRWNCASSKPFNCASNGSRIN